MKIEFLVRTSLKKYQLEINQINSYYIECKLNILGRPVHVCRSSSSFIALPRANSINDITSCGDPLSNSVRHKWENRWKVNGAKSPGDDALRRLSSRLRNRMRRVTTAGRKYRAQYRSTASSALDG